MDFMRTNGTTQKQEKNQVRFYNKVLKGKTNWRRDGMDNLDYELVSEFNKDNLTMLSCNLIKKDGKK